MLAAAHRIAEARAVVTIDAPFDPAHVTGLFGDRIAEIEAKGEVEVTLAGRPFRIRRSFLDDIAEQNLDQSRIAGLHKALLVFHSPTDDTVGIDNASHIFLAAKHPKSFISLAGADHLLSGTERRRLCRATSSPPGPSAISIWPRDAKPCRTTLRRANRRGARNAPRQFQQEISVGPHRLLADEPVQSAALDSGPGPYDLLLAGARRLHLDDDAALRRSQAAAARADHGPAPATTRSTPPTAPNAKPRRA